MGAGGGVYALLLGPGAPLGRRREEGGRRGPLGRLGSREGRVRRVPWSLVGQRGTSAPRGRGTEGRRGPGRAARRGAQGSARRGCPGPRSARRGRRAPGRGGRVEGRGRRPRAKGGRTGSPPRGGEGSSAVFRRWTGTPFSGGGLQTPSLSRGSRQPPGSTVGGRGCCPRGRGSGLDRRLVGGRRFAPKSGGPTHRVSGEDTCGAEGSRTLVGEGGDRAQGLGLARREEPWSTPIGGTGRALRARCDMGLERRPVAGGGVRRGRAVGGGVVGRAQRYASTGKGSHVDLVLGTGTDF